VIICVVTGNRLYLNDKLYRVLVLVLHVVTYRITNLLPKCLPTSILEVTITPKTAKVAHTTTPISTPILEVTRAQTTTSVTTLNLTHLQRTLARALTPIALVATPQPNPPPETNPGPNLGGNPQPNLPPETNPSPNVAPTPGSTVVTSSPSDISHSLNLSPNHLSDSQPTSTATQNANANIISVPRFSGSQTSSKFTLINSYGVNSLSPSQSLGNSSAVNTTIPTTSHVSKGSSIEPIVGGVLGALAFILLTVVAFLCIRRHRRRYRIAPSSLYLANQYPYPFTSEVSRFRDDFIGDGLRPNTPSFLDVKPTSRE